MNKKVISSEGEERLRGIHQLSREYNKRVDMPHTQRLFSLMRKHIDEIEGLWKKGDDHFLVETGDLLILGFEMLLEYQRSLDETLLLCFERYEKKLSQLMKAISSQSGNQESNEKERL